MFPEGSTTFAGHALGFLLAIIFFLPGEIFAKNVTEITEFFHNVSPGETLNKIARRYLPLTKAFSIGDLVEKIRNLNNIQGTLIRPNQRHLIPLHRSSAEVAKKIPKQVDF